MPAMMPGGCERLQDLRMLGVAASVDSGEQAGLCPAADPFSLAAANINPVTGLSTDYLNHFNEAIMLLEMIPALPACIADLQAWQPRTYEEHFWASRLTHRELTIAAYDLADPPARSAFDALCAAMTTVILAAREVLAEQNLPAVAEGAVARLKPMAARASAIIHGADFCAIDAASLPSSQDAIDAVLAR